MTNEIVGPQASFSCCRSDKGHYIGHSPVVVVIKVTIFGHSPVVVVIKVTIFDHSPVVVVIKVTIFDHSPVVVVIKVTIFDMICEKKFRQMNICSTNKN